MVAAAAAAATAAAHNHLCLALPLLVRWPASGSVCWLAAVGARRCRFCVPPAAGGSSIAATKLCPHLHVIIAIRTRQMQESILKCPRCCAGTTLSLPLAQQGSTMQRAGGNLLQSSCSSCCLRTTQGCLNLRTLALRPQLCSRVCSTGSCPLACSDRSGSCGFCSSLHARRLVYGSSTPVMVGSAAKHRVLTVFCH